MFGNQIRRELGEAIINFIERWASSKGFEEKTIKNKESWFVFIGGELFK